MVTTQIRLAVRNTKRENWERYDTIRYARACLFTVTDAKGEHVSSRVEIVLPTPISMTNLDLLGRDLVGS